MTEPTKVTVAGSLEEVVELARLSAARVVTDDDTGHRYLVTPEGSEVLEILNPDVPLPKHITAKVKLGDAESFISYLSDFADSYRSRVFVDIDTTTMTAHLDYHVGSDDEGISKHSHDQHIATWTMQRSEQWKRWTAIDGQMMEQRKFAEFIEENQLDIVEPPGADMLEIATTLQAKSNIDFASGIRLQSGQVQFLYHETIDGKAGADSKLEVPAKIILGIPVFFGGEPYRVEAFLRYRITSGKLTFKVDLHRRALILHDAVAAAVKRVKDETSLPVLYGAASNQKPGYGD